MSNVGERLVEAVKEALAGDYAAITVDGKRWERVERGYAVVPVGPMKDLDAAGEWSVVIINGQKWVKLPEGHMIVDARTVGEVAKVLAGTHVIVPATPSWAIANAGVESLLDQPQININTLAAVYIAMLRRAKEAQ